MAETEKGQKLYKVPPSARPGWCQACAAPVYVFKIGGRRMQVDCDAHPGAFHPTPEEAGLGVLHWEVCD